MKSRMLFIGKLAVAAVMTIPFATLTLTPICWMFPNSWLARLPWTDIVAGVLLVFGAGIIIAILACFWVLTGALTLIKIAPLFPHSPLAKMANRVDRALTDRLTARAAYAEFR